MSGIRRVSDLGTRGAVNIVDGSIQIADISNGAVTQAKLSADVSLSGLRNVLINGDFRIWQRGIGPTATSTGSGQGYLADRWTCARSGYAAGGTVSRQSAGLTGFQFCSRVQRTNGNTSTAIFYYFQTLETANSLPFAGQQVTYSFYARAGSTFTGSITARLLGGTATDQLNYPDSAITGQSAVVSQNITLTTSWQRFTFTGTVGAAVTQLFAGFEWTPSGTAGANDFFEITGVQLEIGPQATPFEQRPYGVELALCQRYYEKYASGYYLISGVYGASAYINVVFKERKRATPTISGLSGGSFDGANVDNFGVGQAGNAWVLTSWEANAEL